MVPGLFFLKECVFGNFLIFELDALDGTINTTMVGLHLGELFTWSGYILRATILTHDVTDAIVQS